MGKKNAKALGAKLVSMGYTLATGGTGIGAPALTTRKMMEADFEQIGVFLDGAMKIALKIQAKSGPKLKDFVAMLDGNEEMAALKAEINKFAIQFPMPGFDPKDMKYNTI